MKETQVILNRLLDKYERSKHLSEPHASNRRVMLRVSKKELPEYDYEDARIRDAYNAAAQELERQSLVQLEWARAHSVLSTVILELAQIMSCYAQANRAHPRLRAERVASLVSDGLADTPVPWIAAWRDHICEDAKSRLRVPAFCEKTDDFLRDLILTFQRYAALSGGVTARAFSSQCFHDTKYFEHKIQDTFLHIAGIYCADLAAVKAEDAVSAKEELGKREQLAFLGIYTRPELYELSGDCVIQTAHGRLCAGAAGPFGLALPSTLVDAVTDVDLKKIRLITFIENKTNYDEYLVSEKQPDELVVYHGGFLSPQKKKLFAKLAGAHGGATEIRFWADIDLGGFRMFEQLQLLIPQVKPMRMEGKYVEQYHQNGLSRPQKYIDKLAEDLKAGLHPRFADAIREILKYGVTIEQEAFLE